jgi:hypothetical protein
MLAFGVRRARVSKPLPFFLFLSGGPGLAGWILYRSLLQQICQTNCQKKKFLAEIY